MRVSRWTGLLKKGFKTRDRELFFGAALELHDGETRQLSSLRGFEVNILSLFTTARKEYSHSLYQCTKEHSLLTSAPKKILLQKINV